MRYTDDFLNEKRQLGDRDADIFIQSAFADQEHKIALRTWLNSFKTNHQLHELSSAYGDYDFITHANKLPAWANPVQMKDGAAFFAIHAQSIMNLLGLLSLPYCYTAANGAMVLYLSDRMKTDTGKRLFETAEFVWDVMAPDAFSKNGKGFASALKIRLMHSAARYYTLKSKRWEDSWGFPVNQEDMAGTNLSFSLLVIRGLRKFGFAVTYKEQQDFIHLWNVIGALLGLDLSMIPEDGKQAVDLERSIRIRQFKSSKQGVELTAGIVKYISTANLKQTVSPIEVKQIMRYLLGEEVADLLGIAESQLPAYKIRLLKSVNFLNDLWTVGKPQLIYQKEYHKFKQSKSKV